MATEMADIEKMVDTIQVSRTQCSRVRAVVAAQPENWRLARQLEMINDRRMDLEGQMVEHLAAYLCSIRSR